MPLSPPRWRIQAPSLALVLGTLLSVALLAAQEGGTKPVVKQAPSRPQTPTLSGVWQALGTAASNLEAHTAQLGIAAGQGVVVGGEIPYRPGAIAQRQMNIQNRASADPLSKCFLPGIPRATYLPFPFEIVQTPRHIQMIYEYAHATRTIYLDGSAHPSGLDFWMGDSRGHWEGRTLVVDVTNFNDQTWFDAAGNFHSDVLHVVERYTPVDRDHLDYEVTIEDDKVFTRPWKISMPLYRRIDQNVRILEYECVQYLQLLQYKP